MALSSQAPLGLAGSLQASVSPGFFPLCDKHLLTAQSGPILASVCLLPHQLLNPMAGVTNATPATSPWLIYSGL